MRELTAITREELVKGACVLGASALVAGAGLTQALADEPVAEEPTPDGEVLRGQYGFWVNTENCVDCGQCAHACRRKNGTPEDVPCRRKIIETENAKGQVRYVSVSCMHCCDPSCMKVCPAGAISKRMEDGMVVVNRDRCIGCKYCYQACPFEVPHYVDYGMDKCDACIANGLYPEVACATACTHDALHFGPIDELLAEAGPTAYSLSATTGPNLIIS